MNNSNNKIFIFWIKYCDFYNISKNENKYIYQNLNDENSYNLVKDKNNINHYFIENANHCDVDSMSIKSKLVDDVLNNILYN